MSEKKGAWVVATLDTKRDEAEYVCGLLDAAGLPVTLADLSTKNRAVDRDTHLTSARKQVSAAEIAAHHPQGESAVFCGDRGGAIAAMTQAFERFVKAQDELNAVLGIGGSGGTAMITRGMRVLPIGVPKVMVSTMASGNVAPWVDIKDITMMFSVTDIMGLNPVTRKILANAAAAVCGMAGVDVEITRSEKPVVAITTSNIARAPDAVEWRLMFNIHAPSTRSPLRVWPSRFGTGMSSVR